MSDPARDSMRHYMEGTHDERRRVLALIASMVERVETSHPKGSEGVTYNRAMVMEMIADKLRQLAGQVGAAE